MKRHIRFTKLGWIQIDRASLWWRQHGDKAPDALDHDVDAAIDVLRSNPHIGTPVRSRHGHVRALWLERIGYLLYYRILGDGTVEVMRFWHASRGSRPRL